jgi:hypothetical protein
MVASRSRVVVSRREARCERTGVCQIYKGMLREGCIIGVCRGKYLKLVISKQPDLSCECTVQSLKLSGRHKNCH